MLKCDKHKKDLAHMGGRSAHRSNWYCPECDKEKEGEQPMSTRGESVPVIIYDKMAAMDNQDVPLEEWPDKLIDALARSGYAIVPLDLPPQVLGDAAIAGVLGTGNPKHCWDFLVGKARTRGIE